MPLHVHTARLSHGRWIGYAGIDRFNVTRGSGGPAGAPFAPSAQLLAAALASKRQCKGDEEKLDFLFAWYAVFFTEEMRASYRTNRGAWLSLLARGRVTLCCYCGTARRCHRRLLAEILVKLGAVDEGER